MALLIITPSRGLYPCFYFIIADYLTKIRRWRRLVCRNCFSALIFFDLDFLVRFGACAGIFLLFGFRFTSSFFCAVSPNQPFMRLLHPSFFPLSSISFFHGRRGIASLTAIGSDEKDKLLCYRNQIKRRPCLLLGLSFCSDSFGRCIKLFFKGFGLCVRSW